MKRCSVFSGRLSLKAVLISILIILVCSSAFCGCVSAVAYDGSGTASDPYLIESAHDLKRLAKDIIYWDEDHNYTGKFFKVTADIDLSGEEWTPIGRYFADDDSTNSYCPFMGNFDGGGHTISNLYVNNPSKYGQGLFGTALNANITNVRLTNVRVIGNSEVGGLVGCYDCKSGTHFIENCSVSGKVSGKNNWVGGIVGYNYIEGDGTTLTIKDSCFDGTVSSNGDYCVGGIVGINYVCKDGKVTVTNCNASGTVSGSNYVGGIVGYIYTESGGKVYVKSSTAFNSYVNGGSNVGRIVGFTEVNESGIVKLTNNYGWKGMKNDITGNLFTDNIGLNEINGADLVLTSEAETPTPTEKNTSQPTAKPTQSPMPVIGLLAGLCAAALLVRRK